MPLSLTVEERILLHLGEFRGLEGKYEMPAGLTQRGIAESVGVQQKHLSRHIQKIVAGGLAEEATCRVSGMKQRMKVYLLTPSGFKRSAELRAFLGPRVVRVRLKSGGEQEIPISDIDKNTSVHLTFADIVRLAHEDDVLDMSALEVVEEEKRRLADRETHREVVYKKALLSAWRSGILTPSERQLVDVLRHHLGLSQEDHDRIEREVMRDIDYGAPERRELYDELRAIAHANGEPSAEAKEMLRTLRKRLMVPEDTAC
jgi:DNA-binding MarR family transcriptional regulator